MKVNTIVMIRNVAACALCCAFSAQASAGIARFVSSHGATDDTLQGAADVASSCSHAFQDLGLKPNVLDTREPGSHGTLRYAGSKERDTSAQARECAQRHWPIPTNDLMVMLGR